MVHPDDDRYKKLIGKKVLIPLIDREIPVIADDYVDPTFGTGIVKVTPAHDFNDYEVGVRHNLPLINIFNDNAELSRFGRPICLTFNIREIIEKFKALVL